MQQYMSRLELYHNIRGSIIIAPCYICQGEFEAYGNYRSHVENIHGEEYDEQKFGEQILDGKMILWKSGKEDEEISIVVKELIKISAIDVNQGGTRPIFWDKTETEKLDL